MKFIKQLSEDEFVVKMESCDADKKRNIVLAHDYLQFDGQDWYCTNLNKLNTPYGFGNVIKIRSSVQIPIRMAQDMLNKVLTKDREYLKNEHLFDRDKTPLYRDVNGLTYSYRKDDGTQMIAVYVRETDEYVHVLKSFYDTIKNA